MEKSFKLISIILIVILLCVIGFLFYDKNKEKDQYLNTINKLEDQVRELEKENKSLKKESDPNEITLKKLLGTYFWNAKTDNFTLKLTLILKDDGSAVYETSNGTEVETTTGNFIYENGKIIYTKEYYGTKNKDKAYDGDKKTETFLVIDKDTLQNTFYNQTTALKKAVTNG